MGTVMVFSPAPQLTVTVEPSSDGDEIHLHAGGQGVWQARMIRALGARVVLCAPLGGEVGRVLRGLIAAEQIPLVAVEVTADNGAYLHDRRQGRRQEIARAPGRKLSRHEQDELYGVALTEGLAADVSTLGGTMEDDILPPDMYRRLAADLRRNGKHVIADLSGDLLTAALKGGLDLVKVSHEELLRDGWAAADTVPELISAMRRMRVAGAVTVVVSRAERPALALVGPGVREIRGPLLEPADAAGAGDSMMAGVAASLAVGDDLATAVRTGAAAGALNVTRRGLGTGDAEKVRKLMALVSFADVPSTVDVAGPMTADVHLTPEQLARQVRRG